MAIFFWFSSYRRMEPQGYTTPICKISNRGAGIQRQAAQTSHFILKSAMLFSEPVTYTHPTNESHSTKSLAMLPK